MSSSTVNYNGAGHTPTYVSATQLTISLAATDQATAGTYAVIVTNPSPGGGASNSMSFTVDNPVPTITSFSPASVESGSAAQQFTITGTNFVSGSMVSYNGAAQTATFVSATQLKIALTAADQATAGTFAVVVTNPTPGGGASNSVDFTVDNPVPTITSFSPASVESGSAAQQLTITGTNFVSGSTVTYNGAAQTASLVSATQLTITLTATDQATAGIYPVIVTNPTPGGGASNEMNFTVVLSGLTTISQPSNDLVWDPENLAIYLSVPSSAGSQTGNTITVVDPAAGTIGTSVFAGSEPDALAISGDSEFVYVALDGSSTVQRFTLPTLATDISYPLGSDSFSGPYYAVDLQVATGAPRTTAVTRGVFNSSAAAVGGVAIYDDATMRPTFVCSGWGSCPSGGTSPGGLFDSLQWGADSSVLYAENGEDTGFDFYVFSVTAQGVTETEDYGSAFSTFGARIHYDAGTQMIYSDDGHVVDPATGAPAGNFEVSGVMVPDSTVSKAFFLGQTSSQTGSQNYTLESFNISQFTPIDSVQFPNVSGKPLRLIRWGSNGVAFNTTGGQLYLYQGSIVAESAEVTSAKLNQLLADPVRRTWKTPPVKTLRRAQEN